MPEKSLHRRLPATVTRKASRLHHHLPSGRLAKQSSPSSRPAKIFERCLSEPMLGGSRDRDDQKKQRRSLWSDDGIGDHGDGVLYGALTFTDAFASSPSLLTPFPAPPAVSPSQGYRKDAKVVINVTVEGSPGPLRTMVELGSTVEDTIKVVAEKYGEEGRTPKLDKDAAFAYELHRSYFSLQSIDKSELIGDIGSRSFYLRKTGNNHGASEASTEAIPMMRSESPPSPILPPPFLLPAFIARKLCKFERRTRRIWKVLFCST